jgi:hypothetical protein
LAGKRMGKVHELTYGSIATGVGVVVAPVRLRGGAGRWQPRASQFR